MVLNRINRVSFVIALAAALVLLIPVAGFTHPGGTDKYGCHAGSKPYHCHGGGSAPKKRVSTGPSAAERAKQAKLNQAKSDLSQAKTKHYESKEKAEELEQKLDTTAEKLEEQRTELAGVQSEIDRNREDAQTLRNSWIADREVAAERIALVSSKNDENREMYEIGVLGSAFFGSFFSVFLLYRVARSVASRIRGFLLKLILIVLGFFLGWLLVLLAAVSGNLVVGALLLSIAGLLFGFLLMLLRMWLIAATMPPKLAFSLLAVTTVLAVLFLVGVFSAPPATQSPAQADVIMADELEADPVAEELLEANEIDIVADKLQTDVDKLAEDLDALETKAEDLAEQAEEAQEIVKEYEAEVVLAEVELQSVQ